MTNSPVDPAVKEESPLPAPPGMRMIESSELFAEQKTVLIHHQGSYYRLTITRNGKLILQK